MASIEASRGLTLARGSEGQGALPAVQEAEAGIDRRAGSFILDERVSLGGDDLLTIAVVLILRRNRRHKGGGRLQTPRPGSSDVVGHRTNRAIAGLGERESLL